MNFVNSSENKNEIFLNSSYKNIYNDEIMDSMISNENSIKKENDYNLISQEDSLNYNNGNSPLFSKNNSVIKDNGKRKPRGKKSNKRPRKKIKAKII